MVSLDRFGHASLPPSHGRQDTRNGFICDVVQKLAQTGTAILLYDPSICQSTPFKSQNIDALPSKMRDLSEAHGAPGGLLFNWEVDASGCDEVSGIDRRFTMAGLLRMTESQEVTSRTKRRKCHRFA